MRLFHLTASYQKYSNIPPMDCCAFELLKQALYNHHPITLDRLWKNLIEEWKEKKKNLIFLKMLF